MKLYSISFSLQTRSPARIWTPPHSDFAVGVKVLDNGTAVTADLTLKGPDGSTLTPEASKVDGFKVYKMKSGAPGSGTYTLEVAGVQGAFKLVHITTDSTVFDVGGSVSGGGDMSDYYTKSETDGLLSAKADESDLTAYATTESLTAYATTDSLTAYATTESLTAYAETGDLTAFYEKSETSSATQITNGLKGKVNNISGVANVRKISQADYDALSAGGTADANTLYVIV